MTSPPSTAPITLERPADGTPLPPTHPDFVPFGSRLLKDPSDVYSHNAWDHVTPPPEWEIQARETLEVQKQGMVGDKMKWAYNSKPSLYWNRFYDINKDKFFKDRNWLRLEFPELLACAEEDAGPKLVVEIGCGAGNTVFPLLAKNENPQLVVHACDYAPSAVELVKSNPNYPVPPHGKGRLFSSVWDLTCPPVRADDASSSTPPTESSHDEPPREPRRNSLPEGIEEGTVDVAVMIYVMSALHPGEWARAVANAWKMLKPNGLLFIRDYGRYDLAQLRIKKGRMLQDNFYVRGDGTRVYFFEASELSQMLTGKKDAYTPMENEPTVEIDQTDPGTGTSTQPSTPSPTESAPTPTTSEPGKLFRHKPDDLKVETERLSRLALAVGAEPLSTRFRTPSPVRKGTSDDPVSTGTGTRDGHGEGDGEGEYDPFAHQEEEELGVPAMPLFRIDQLGIDRRMLVNRKRQLKMYRIWMQVKARKLV